MHIRTHKVMLVDDYNTTEGSHKMHASIFCTPMLPGALLTSQKCVVRKEGRSVCLTCRMAKRPPKV